jgi:uncharacterized protein YndB with AHSA1/START domain
MHTDRVAEASININAPRDAVWRALLDPAAIKEYMFGTTVQTNWEVGSDIRWRGEWNGRKYEDKGKVLRVVPGKQLSYTHFSPLSGNSDTLDHYHTVTISLTPEGSQTAVTLTQDNNPDEDSREHSEENWVSMLMALKRHVEAPFRPSSGS